MIKTTRRIIVHNSLVATSDVEITYFAAPSLRRLSLLSSNRTSEEKQTKKGWLMGDKEWEEKGEEKKKGIAE